MLYNLIIHEFHILCYIFLGASEEDEFPPSWALNDNLR